MPYTYPTSYKVKSALDQSQKIAELFPQLPIIGTHVSMPDNHPEADGIFFIPHFKHFGTYNEAVEKVLAKIKENRTFKNWLENKTGPKNLRQTKVKEDWWDKQPDTILLPVQTGKKYAGKSVVDVRNGIDHLYSSEIPFGTYEMGIILLTHPERLQDYNDLWIDCAGDQFRSEAKGDWDKAPFFLFDGGQLRLGAKFVHNLNDSYGSVSGFVSQSVGPSPLAPSDSLNPVPLDSFNLMPLNPLEQIALQLSKMNLTLGKIAECFGDTKRAKKRKK